MKLHLTLFKAALAIASASISLAFPFPSASDTSLADIKGEGKYHCKYESIANEVATNLYVYGQYKTKDFTACVTKCDNDNECYAAIFDSTAPEYTCQTADGPHYQKAPLQPKQGAMTAQIVRNSCKKAAAKAVPLDCKPDSTVNGTAKFKCEYNVKCKTQLGSINNAEYGSFNTSQECLDFCDGSTYCYAVTYYAGGQCRLTSAMHYQTAPTVEDSNAETYELVKGSCKKKAAN